MRLADTPEGELLFETNELRIRSTYGDPAACRIGSHDGLSKGFIAFDHLRPDGRHVMMAMIQGKQDERARGTALPQAEITVFCNDGTGEHDGAMRHVMTIRHDGIRFHVPVTLPNGVRYP